MLVFVKSAFYRIYMQIKRMLVVNKCSELNKQALVSHQKPAYIQMYTGKTLVHFTHYYCGCRFVCASLHHSPFPIVFHSANYFERSTCSVLSRNSDRSLNMQSISHSLRAFFCGIIHTSLQWLDLSWIIHFSSRRTNFSVCG